MKEKLEESITQTITLSKEKLIWVKKGKEIKINGKMFDIKSIETNKNGDYVVSGLYDEQEDKLFASIDKILSQKENANPFTSIGLNWIQQLLYTPYHSFDAPIMVVADINKKLPIYISSTYISPYLSHPPIPPWECIV